MRLGVPDALGTVVPVAVAGRGEGDGEGEGEGEGSGLWPLRGLRIPSLSSVKNTSAAWDRKLAAISKPGDRNDTAERKLESIADASVSEDAAAGVAAAAVAVAAAVVATAAATAGTTAAKGAAKGAGSGTCSRGGLSKSGFGDSAAATGECSTANARGD